mmetsp:Transcript_13698/g.45067  ORF Transcript_13698/g.45067 Transcript_13698/m.45067 type:complete len:265 (-) Transcript_13698:359-1153(-)
MPKDVVAVRPVPLVALAVGVEPPVSRRGGGFDGFPLALRLPLFLEHNNGAAAVVRLELLHLGDDVVVLAERLEIPSLRPILGALRVVKVVDEDPRVFVDVVEHEECGGAASHAVDEHHVVARLSKLLGRLHVLRALVHVPFELSVRIRERLRRVRKLSRLRPAVLDPVLQARAVRDVRHVHLFRERVVLERAERELVGVARRHAVHQPVLQMDVGQAVIRELPAQPLHKLPNRLNRVQLLHVPRKIQCRTSAAVLQHHRFRREV